MDSGDQQLPHGQNERSSSTSWEWRRVRVDRGAAGSKAAARKGHRWKRFGRRDATQPITTVLKYRGGAQAWILVTARGESNIYAGDTALIDVLNDINQTR